MPSPGRLFGLRPPQPHDAAHAADEHAGRDEKLRIGGHAPPTRQFGPLPPVLAEPHLLERLLSVYGGPVIPVHETEFDGSPHGPDGEPCTPDTQEGCTDEDGGQDDVMCHCAIVGTHAANCLPGAPTSGGQGATAARCRARPRGVVHLFPMEPSLTSLLAVGRALTDQALRLHQLRRRLRVMVHRAFFTHGHNDPRQQFFIWVTNLSPKREVVITHIWFETNPRKDVLNPERPLPKRLPLDERWETWKPVADVPAEDDLERKVRVQLSSGKVVKSRLNKDVPPMGHVAGP